MFFVSLFQCCTYVYVLKYSRYNITVVVVAVVVVGVATVVMRVVVVVAVAATWARLRKCVETAMPVAVVVVAVAGIAVVGAGVEVVGVAVEVDGSLMALGVTSVKQVTCIFCFAFFLFCRFLWVH